MLKRKSMLLVFLPLCAAGLVLSGCGKAEDEAAPAPVIPGKGDASAPSNAAEGAKKEKGFAGAGGLPSASGPAAK